MFEEDELNVTTTSSVGHKVDIFYYGPDPVVGPSILERSNDQIIDSVFQIVGFSQRKPLSIYRPETGRLMQCLNWLAISEPNPNDTTIMCTNKTITIPKDGVYMIKLRSSEIGSGGLANITINGNTTYSSAPFYYSSCQVELRAFWPKFSIMAYSATPSIDDPMLFVEGNVSERVVGFNDDRGGTVGSLFSLPTYDACVTDSFLVKTSSIHISSYGSLLPESTCNIRVVAYDDDAISFSPILRKGDKEILANHKEGEMVNVTSFTTLDGLIRLSSSDEISTVCVYDIQGVLLSTIGIKDKEASIPIEKTCIRRRGMYVIVTKTEKGTKVHKVYVK